MQLTGDKRLRKLLKKTPDHVLSRAIAPAVRRSMAPVSKQAKKLITQHKLHDRSGLLRKSISLRSKRYTRKGVIWVGVGSRKGMRQVVTTRTGRTVLRDPAKYAHLIEHGFTHRSGRMVAPRSFIGRAMQQHQSQVQRSIAAELGHQIPRVVARLAKRSQKS